MSSSPSKGHPLGARPQRLVGEQTVNINAASSLMENFLQQTPVSGGTQIAAFSNAQGLDETVSIGSDGTVYHFYPDTNSETGWGQISIAFPGPVQCVAALLTSDGYRMVIAGVTGGKLCYALDNQGSALPVWSQAVALEVNAPYAVLSRSFAGQSYVSITSPCGVAFSTMWATVGTGSPRLSFTVNTALDLVTDPHVDFSASGNPMAVITPTVGLLYTNAYNLVLSVEADTNASFWRPQIPSVADLQNRQVWWSVGDVAVAGIAAPSSDALLVQWINPPENVYVLGTLISSYGSEAVWTTHGDTGGVWNPVAPYGFNALGSVASGDSNAPTVQVAALSPVCSDVANTSQAIWNDKGSGSRGSDLTVYAITPPSGTTFEPTGAFVSQPNYDAPDTPGCLPFDPSWGSFFVGIDGDFSEAAFTAASWAVDASSDTPSWIVAVDTSGLLWFTALPEVNWTQLASEQPDLVLTGVMARSDAANIEVLALATDSSLYHLIYNGSSWSSAIEVLADVQHFDIATDQDGWSSAFCVTSSSQLVRLWRSAQSAWQAETIATQNGAIVAQTTYTSVLTATDQNGFPIAAAQAQVWSSEQQMLNINGGTYVVDSVRPANLPTDAKGQLVIASVTGTLATGTLSLWVAPMTAGTAVQIEPNGGVYTMLSKVSAQEVQAATDGEGVPLLASEYQDLAQPLASAMQELMVLAAPSASAAALPRHVLFGKRLEVKRCGHVHTGRRLCVPTQARRSWTISFAPGARAFRLLSPQEALVQRARAMNKSQDADGNSLFEDLVDLARGAALEAVEVVNASFNWVGEQLTAVVDFILDGVRYVWNAIVETAQAAFDFVELIWEQAQVGFDRLCQWVGFLFDWQDILRTAKAMNYSIDTLLGFLQSALLALQVKIDDALQGAQASVHALVQQIQEYINPNQSFSQLAASQSSSDADISESLTTNVLGRAVANDATSTAGNGAFALPVEYSDAVDGIWETFETYLSSLADNPGFSSAKAYFEAASSEPDGFWRSTLSGLIALLEGVVEAALAGLQLVVDALISGIVQLIGSLRAMLSTPLTSDNTSPLVLGIINLAGLQGASLGSLCALTVAVPVTVIWKLVADAAPFPTDADEESLEQAFTVDVLMRVSGLASSNSTPQLPMPSDDVMPPILVPLFHLTYGCGYLVLAGVASAVDMFPLAPINPIPGKPTSPSNSIVGVYLIAQAATVVGSIPWIVGLPSSPAGAGFAVADWIVSSILFITEGLVAVVTAKTGETKLLTNLGIGGVWADVGFGFLNVALGAVTEVLDHDPVDAVEQVLSGFPGITRMFRLDPKATMVAVAFDAVCYYSAGAIAAIDAAVQVGELSVSTSPESKRLDVRRHLFHPGRLLAA